ncbi:hypothetical protein ANN_15168, partial [Periplaneta americana]
IWLCYSISALEGDDFVAPAFGFLMAGFETSSSTMCFALYELALQPNLQERLRTEILEVMEKYDNEVTYDGIQEMKYLDMVVSGKLTYLIKRAANGYRLMLLMLSDMDETLRKYPILPFLDRKNMKDYDLPHPSGKGTVTIPAGTGVYIPLLGTQYDPDIFPDPDRFDPERFSEQNKNSFNSYAYLPFGEGPRFCIGKRFGLMQTKTGLIHLFSRYEVSPCKETPVPLVMNKKAFVVASVEAIPLTFKRLAT